MQRVKQTVIVLGSCIFNVGEERTN